MALRPNRPTDPGPVREPGRQSLLNLVDLNAGATRRRRLRWKMLTGLSATGLALAGGLALVALQVPQLGPAIRAGHGEGTRGEFTLQQYDCGRFLCTWAGVFVADKGRLTLQDAAFSGHVPAALARVLPFRRSTAATRVRSIRSAGRTRGSRTSHCWPSMSWSSPCAAGSLSGRSG